MNKAYSQFQIKAVSFLMNKMCFYNGNSLYHSRSHETTYYWESVTCSNMEQPVAGGSVFGEGDRKEPRQQVRGGRERKVLGKSAVG